MNNTISISFSDNSFQLVYSTEENAVPKLIACNQYPFSQDASLDLVFQESILKQVSDAITEVKTDNNLSEAEVIFTVPFNYAKIKKVAIPADSDKTVKRKQIRWELETEIDGPISEYKISVLSEQKKEAFTEVTVVAIKKSLLAQLQQTTTPAGLKINGILLNCFALENFLQQSEQQDEEKNHIFLKIGHSYIEQHVFSENRYVSSYLDSLIETKNRPHEEFILETVKEHHKQIAGLAAQSENNDPFKLIVYGNAVSETVLETLKNGMSISVDYGGISAFPGLDGFKYIEAWGSIL